MFGSSMLSFGGKHDLNPNHLRQCLYIPEDQLKILNSLPGWSKEPESNADRLIKGTESTILISQASNLETEGNQSRHKENIEAFNKYLKTKALYPFSSSFNRQRHKSDPNIKDIELKQDLLKSSLRRSNSDLSLYKNCDKLLFHTAEVSEELVPDSINSKLNKFSSESAKLSVSNIIAENSKAMEVVLPVNASCHQNKVAATPTEALHTVTVQINTNGMSSESVGKAINEQNFKSSAKQPDSEDNLTGSIREQDCENSIANSAPQISQASDQEKAVEKSLQSLGVITQVNDTPVFTDTDKRNANLAVVENISKSEIISNLPKPMEVDENIFGKQAGINVVQNVPTSSSVSDKNSVGGQSLEFDGKNKIEDCDKDARSATLTKTNDPIKGKRKSDSKKHSKRLRSLEKKERSSRSLKNVSNITYSKEEIDIMLDLLKQFL